MPSSTSVSSAFDSTNGAGMYVGRFAPSPTGPLHLGSVVAALASWLDACAAAASGWHARWLVRIEDLDSQRCTPAAAHTILRQLDALGLRPDALPEWQSRRSALYAQALQRLRTLDRAYPCACTRKQIEQAWQQRGVVKGRFETLVYPGTCRHAAHVEPVRLWRFALPQAAVDGVDSRLVHWHDRRLGPQVQDVARDVGDFALLRGDGMWSYQMGCVVDDGAQGVTHVVRGEDLADNTARQLLLQSALSLPAPVYLHVPLARDARGEKLSKGNHAPSIDGQAPLAVLRAAAAVLQLPPCPSTTEQSVAGALQHWVQAWRERFPLAHAVATR